MVFLFALLHSTAGTYSCSGARLELVQEQHCSEEPWPEPAVSILPDALLLRQLWVGAGCTGWGALRSPHCSTTAATGCTEPPTDHPIRFHPKTHFIPAPTVPGEKCSGLGQSRSL